MKKPILLALFSVVFVQITTAQFYLQARGGFAFSTAKERILGLKRFTNLDASRDDGERFYVSTAQGKNSAENFYGTGGEGITSGVAAGYFFNKYIGAELGVSYFSSKHSLVQQTASISGSFRIDAKFEANSNQIRVLPALVIRGSNEGLQPYARFGLVAPVYGQVDIVNNVQLNNGYGLTTYENDEQVLAQTSKIVFNGAFSLGYNTAFGLHIPLSPRTSVNIETELLTLGVRGGKSAVSSTQGITTDLKTNQIIKISDDFTVNGFETVYGEVVGNFDDLIGFEVGRNALRR